MPNKEENVGITVKKEDDMPEWYEQVCLKSKLVDFGVVKGTMVIRPNGFFIWQSIQDYFNKNIVEKTKTRNAYFPLFVPESFFKKEASHAEGFSPEVAWLDKSLTKDSERLAIRPTSETIIYDSYSKWIRSYRDLPLKMNQWCNIVRWETEATKLFLRSREFLWQEGHCVYETEEECEKETLMYAKLYQELCKDLLALPVMTGRKTEKEKFAGADHTYSIEAFMPDGKALQCGTSHQLGDGFAKAFSIQYIGKDEKQHYPFQNSWGLSTRLIGAVVMTHSDDKGLVLPPKVAENKLVIVPILFEDTKEKVLKEAKKIEKELKQFNPILDEREEYNPGWKFNEWELKGIPLRVEIGPKDIEKKQVMVVKRTGEKTPIKITDLKQTIPKLLDELHDELYKKAEKLLKDGITEAHTKEELIKAIKNKKIALTPLCKNEECTEHIKDKTGAKTLNIPLDKPALEGTTCIWCNKQADYFVYIGKSY